MLNFVESSPSARLAYQDLSLSELHAAFITLCDVTSMSDINTRQSVEEKKLALIRVVEARAMMKLGATLAAPPLEKKSDDYYVQMARHAAYHFFLLFGFVEKAAGSFLFGSTLFGLIPSLSHVWLMTISIIYTLLDSFLFYAFEVYFLQKAFGMSSAATGEHLINILCAQQLQSAIVINTGLRDKDTLDWDEDSYHQFYELSKLFNEHLLNKQQYMQAYPRSWLKVIIEYGVIIFGALSSVADSYFIAKAALAALDLSMATSPLGWALMTGIIVAGLVFYYAMGVKSMNKLVNPDYESYQSLKKGLTLFKETHRPPQEYVRGRDIVQNKHNSAQDWQSELLEMGYGS